MRSNISASKYKTLDSEMGREPGAPVGLLLGRSISAFQDPTEPAPIERQYVVLR